MIQLKMHSTTYEVFLPRFKTEFNQVFGPNSWLIGNVGDGETC